MGIDVTVVRVFTDESGQFGNPLGIVDADAVPVGRRPLRRVGVQRNGLRGPSADGSTTARARITRRLPNCPFADTPPWERRRLSQRGHPIHTLQVPAGIVQVRYPRA